MTKFMINNRVDARNLTTISKLASDKDNDPVSHPACILFTGDQVDNGSQKSTFLVIRTSSHA